MTQKTVLTDEQIDSLLVDHGAGRTPPPRNLIRAIEQAVLSSVAERTQDSLNQNRAKHYVDGYESGWNAALDEAIQIVDEHEFPVGDSSIDELADNWTHRVCQVYRALTETRYKIRALKGNET